MEYINFPADVKINNKKALQGEIPGEIKPNKQNEQNRVRSEANIECSSPRSISIGQLNALLRLHIRPINLIVYERPYQLMLWDI